MTKPVTRRMVVDWFLSVGHERGTPFRCMICCVPLNPGDDVQWDHYHAIVHNGPHEYQNIRPVHRECHKAKTKTDVQANAKVKRIIAGGRRKRGPQLPSKPFPKTKKKTPSRKFNV